MRQITHIVLHCTATAQTATVAAIQNYWRNTLKWKLPGYHFLIEASGVVHALQPLDKPSNGVAGHNAHSIHISYIGGIDGKGIPMDTRTANQKRELKRLVLEQLQVHPSAKVCGHRDFPNVHKACPSFDVAAWLKQEGIRG